MPRRCHVCKGDLQPRTIRYTTEYVGRVVVVDNVPALVCDQCGEKLFEPNVAARLQELVWGRRGQPRKLQVDGYDYSDAKMS
jgi:YgiT-type zinc finger domain-containing protein